MTQQIILGSELKININIEPMINLHMNDYDFICYFYVNQNRSLTVSKDQMKKIDDDNYVAMIDTSRIGVGELKVKVTAYIPDTDFDDSLRTEISTVNTGIQIIK